MTRLLRVSYESLSSYVVRIIRDSQESCCKFVTRLLRVSYESFSSYVDMSCGSDDAESHGLTRDIRSVCVRCDMRHVTSVYHTESHGLVSAGSHGLTRDMRHKTPFGVT